MYAIWTAKPWLVSHASLLDPYRSDYFVWVDAGALKDTKVTHTFTGLAAGLDAIYATVPSSTIVLAAGNKTWTEGTAYVQAAVRGGELDRADRLQGSFYAGTAQAVQWWEKEVMKVVVLQSVMQRFAAKEQIAWTQAARLNWDRVYVQNYALRTGTDCGESLYAGFEYFADGRKCEIPAWSGPDYAKDVEVGGFASGAVKSASAAASGAKAKVSAAAVSRASVVKSGASVVKSGAVSVASAGASGVSKVVVAAKGKASEAASASASSSASK